jgi:hypothetical protein
MASLFVPLPLTLGQRSGMFPELRPEVTGYVAGMTNTQTIYVELLDEGVGSTGPSRPYPILTAYFVFRRPAPVDEHG